jgi:hypothetical protein
VFVRCRKYDAHDGGPPIDYSNPLETERLPRPGAPALAATICFQSEPGRECYFHAAARVAHCGDHFVWELPPPPGCQAAYCAAMLPAEVQLEVFVTKEGGGH